VLILRPEPGASESAARARALGLEPVVAPLFAIRPLAWNMPAGAFDALLLTSANAARHAGPGLAALLTLPCFAVGEATAAAAAAAGLARVDAATGDAADAVAAMAAAGARRALHLCGRDHVAADRPGIAIERRIVYAAEPVAKLPEAAAAALPQALVLLHSPRAAARFAQLAGDRGAIRIAAISAAAAAAAGGGWAELAVAPRPRDQALLELAARLCKSDGAGETERD
jgi:uroporphyrinogen-III synthase